MNGLFIPLKNLPILGKQIRELDKQVGEEGIHQAFKTFLESRDVKVKFFPPMSDKVKKILKENAVVVISNHPHDFEMFTIISYLPPRDKTFVIASDSFMYAGESFSKNIIPVRVRTEKKPFVSRVLDRFITYFPPMKDIESRELNKKSINRAALLIKQGALVIFFPEDTRRGVWQKGIGYMLKDVGDRDIYILKIYIAGVSALDYLRIFPIFRKFMPVIKLNISEPELLKKLIVDKTEPSEITDILHENYNVWIRSIN